MKTIIAEKPSVAREIASLLGASEKKDGYLTGNGYFVTWAFGHLIGLGMPEDYGISGFDKTALPILPNPFILTVRKVKKDKGYTADTGALKQLKVIEQLFNKSESIIVATDAGREGELIFRYIYEYLKCSKPFERLWISSLTEKAIKQGFDNLKSGKEFDGLYQAAQGRSRADWLVGINATQALSIILKSVYLVFEGALVAATVVAVAAVVLLVVAVAAVVAEMQNRLLLCVALKEKRLPYPRNLRV